MYLLRLLLKNKFILLILSNNEDNLIFGKINIILAKHGPINVT